jgi:predicted Zn finger-like uncharacterized protein
MSLITRCPACATLFKVVPDQLRISEGLVRCGQCDLVFDANAYLKPYAAGTYLTSNANLQNGAKVNALSTDEPANATISHGPENIVRGVNIAQSVGQGMDKEDASAGPSAVANAQGHSEEQPSSAYLTASKKNTIEEVQSPYSASNPQPSFLLKPIRRAKRRSRIIQVFLAFFSTVLVVTLLLQFVVHDRDKLAAMEPSVQPFLNALCAALDCKISPLRQIESVVIDSSSFVNVRADVYRLNFTLKNTASIDIATPALELTLMDLQDQAVIRRVIDPSDYGAKSASIAAGTEISMMLPMTVKSSDRTEKYSGYRLVIFYP